MSKTVTLSKELTTHKGPVTSIVVNEPTAGDFRRYGSPVKIIPLDGDRVTFDHDDEKVLKFLTSATGIDGVILDTLSASDYMKLRGALTGIILGLSDGSDPT